MSLSDLAEHNRLDVLKTSNCPSNLICCIKTNLGLNSYVTFYSLNDIRRLGLPDSQSLHLLRPDLPFSTLPITSSGNDREGPDGAGIPIIPSRHGAGEIGSHGSDVGNMIGN